MELICEAVIDLLKRSGLKAQTALPSTAAKRLREPLVSVQMQRWTLEGRPVYLGLMEELELFAHRMEGDLTLGAYALTAEQASGTAAQVVAGVMDGIEGLTLRQLESGAAAYDAALDCFVCPVSAKVEAWLYAVPRDDELYFEDFVMRGELRSARMEQEDKT